MALTEWDVHGAVLKRFAQLVELDRLLLALDP